MKTNINVVETSKKEEQPFIPHFSLPLLGGAKFTPKLAFKDISLEKTTKLLQGGVEGTNVAGSINSSGYGIFAFSVRGVEVGTISFYPSDLDEDSTNAEIKEVTEDLVTKLKDTTITQAIEDGTAMMADW